MFIIVEHTVYWCQMENQIIKEPAMISSGKDKQFPRFPVDKRVVTPKKKKRKWSEFYTKRDPLKQSVNTWVANSPLGREACSATS